MITPTTKLEAVNEILASIGERPVNTLDPTTRLDVVRAESTLDEINKLVQSHGWWFNTYYARELTPAAGEFVLPLNTAKVRVYRRGRLGLGPASLDKHYVLRRDTDSKLKLYDKAGQTFLGNTEAITVDTTEILEFEDLPPTARRYIAIRAAVTFQARTVGSSLINNFIEEEAREAWREMRREELENEAEEGNLQSSPLMMELITKR